MNQRWWRRMYRKIHNFPWCIDFYCSCAVCRRKTLHCVITTVTTSWLTAHRMETDLCDLNWSIWVGCRCRVGIFVSLLRIDTDVSVVVSYVGDNNKTVGGGGWVKNKNIYQLYVCHTPPSCCRGWCALETRTWTSIYFVL